MVRARKGEQHAWLAVALSMFAVAWGGNEFTPLLVLYKQHGSFSNLFIDAMLITYAIGVGAGLLAAGPMSDRYGRRALMLPTPLVAVAASTCIAYGEDAATLMAIGRFLSGLAVGMAMTAGGSWLKELSTPRFDPTAKPSSGAKRASMALTAGFGLGAGVAGVLAQWGPIPGQLAYALHILLTIALYPLIIKVPETRQSAHLNIKGSWLNDIAVPTARDRRFLTVAVPLAPWVFGCGFTAYAILPTLMRDSVTYPIAFTALLCVVTLGVGFLIQQPGPTIVGDGGRRGPLLAMTVTIIGMALAALVPLNHSITLTLIACVFLGLSYGLCVFTGLSEVQRIAPPNDLAGLMGLFYCCTYVGMIFPAILTKLDGTFTYPQMLGFGAAVATLILLALIKTAKKQTA
ncbi:MFS transporter [Corynebacterium aquilae]|uniref:MFS transporter permease n=1 Tax=Corynebacterium aquilae DSM 44791 TaxID=1431546 RepID=A0A1L7CDI1_9CORY|nr:MFS transporter [Corynebacterium aquilae]APT83886.1 MFS transporter permease [Corynebacterium aquilae DSM 44791]